VSKKIEISSFMAEDDYNYCVRQFGITEDHARGMRDEDWMAFFDCTKADLPFYLLDEWRWEEMLSDPELADLFSETIEDPFDSYEDDFADSEIFDEVVSDDEDLWTSTFSKYSPVTKSPSQPAWLSPRPTATRANPKPKPKKIPHYFVVVR